MKAVDPDRARGLYGKYQVKKIVRGDGGLCAWSPDGVHHAAPGLGHACSYCQNVRHDQLVDPSGPVFVLAYESDPHAAVALAAYAESCAADFPQLAAELREKLRGQPECECHEPACQWCEIHGNTGNRVEDEDPEKVP